MYGGEISNERKYQKRKIAARCRVTYGHVVDIRGRRCRHTRFCGGPGGLIRFRRLFVKERKQPFVAAVVKIFIKTTTTNRTDITVVSRALTVSADDRSPVNNSFRRRVVRNKKSR